VSGRGSCELCLHYDAHGRPGDCGQRVGQDSQGVEALRRMEELGLDIELVQTDGYIRPGQ